jgi:hypothetical protein
MEEGKRYNEGKLKWSLVSWKALVPMVRVLEFGAKKYSGWNWTKGLKYTEVCESLMRHTYSFLEGEDNDSESKIAHVGHILCNAMFLSYMFLFRKDMDDRHIDKNGNKVDKVDEVNKRVPYQDAEAYKEYTFDSKEKGCVVLDPRPRNNMD